MKSSFFCILLMITMNAVCQDNPDMKEPSKESQDYHQYRIKGTTPPYGLTKIKALVKNIKEDDENELQALDSKTYKALSLREKFTYNMIHPESFTQICDVIMPIQDEEKKIFANLPDVFTPDGETGYFWSERQKNFFKDNRDSVIVIIRESVTRSQHFGSNYKQVLADIDAKEMIPFIIEIYNIDRKDHDLLTVLLLLMKNGQYVPFTSSSGYKKLYGENAWYDSFLNYNTANEELTIKRATDYYASLTK